MRLLVVLVMCCTSLILASCSSNSSDNSPTGTNSSSSSEPVATNSTSAADPAPPVTNTQVTDDKWPVEQQLVQNKPWGSENQPQAELEATVKENEKTPDMRLVLALKDYAGWYRGQKKYDEAEKIYRQLADRDGATWGMKPGEAPSNDLGVLYTDMQKYDQAEDQFKRLMARWDVPGDKSALVAQNDIEATQRHNYSVLLKLMGRGEEAQAMEDKADVLMEEKRKALATPPS